MARKDIFVGVNVDLQQATKAFTDLKVKEQDLVNQTKSLKREMAALDAAGKRNSRAFRQTAKAYAATQIELKGVRSRVREASNQLAGLTQNATRFRDKMAGSMTKALKGVAVQFLGITAAIRVLSSTFNTIKEFDSAMVNLAAISGKTRDQIVELEDAARKLGGSTIFTANEVGQLQIAMTKLGFANDEVLASQKAVLTLAQATGEELGSTAEIVAKTVNGFNLSADEAGRVADVMAKSFNTSALNLEKFGVAMANVAPAADAVGLTVEETTAQLAQLIDRGIDASKAGTDLRKIFIELKKQGLTWDQAVNQINGSQDKLTTSVELFGVRAANSGLILANTTGATEDFTAALNNAKGTAQETADVMGESLENSIKNVQSAWEGLILSVDKGDGVLGKTSRGSMAAIAFGLRVVTDTMFEGEQTGLSFAKRIAEAFGVDISDALKGVKEQLEDVNDEFNRGGGLAQGLADAFGQVRDQALPMTLGQIKEAIKELRKEQEDTFNSEGYQAIERQIEAYQRLADAITNVARSTETIEPIQTIPTTSVGEAPTASGDERLRLPGQDLDMLSPQDKAQYEEALAFLQEAYDADRIAYLDYVEEKKRLGDEYLKNRKNQADQEVSIGQYLAQNHESVLGDISRIAGDAANLAEKGTETQKTLAITQALINTYLAASKAFATAGNPIAGGILAALAVASGMAIVSKIRSFSEGGYTGPGGKYDEAGIVHKGEIVWSQEDIKKFGGIAAVERMRPTSKQGRNGQYFDGGIVRQLPSGDAAETAARLNSIERAVATTKTVLVVEDFNEAANNVNVIEERASA